MGAPEQQHVNLSYGISLINMQHEDRNTYRRAKDSTAQNRGTSFFFFFFFASTYGRVASRGKTHLLQLLQLLFDHDGD